MAAAVSPPRFHSRPVISNDSMSSARNDGSIFGRVLHLRSVLLVALLLVTQAAGLGQSTILLEAENLSPTGSGQTISSGADTAASGGMWVKITSDALGEW